MVSFSEETKDEINWDLLDYVAWCQIQKLTVTEGVSYFVPMPEPRTWKWLQDVLCHVSSFILHFQSLMDYLSRRSRCQR